MFRNFTFFAIILLSTQLEYSADIECHPLDAVGSFSKNPTNIGTPSFEFIPTGESPVTPEEIRNITRGGSQNSSGEWIWHDERSECSDDETTSIRKGKKPRARHLSFSLPREINAWISYLNKITELKRNGMDISNFGAEIVPLNWENELATIIGHADERHNFLDLEGKNRRELINKRARLISRLKHSLPWMELGNRQSIVNDEANGFKVLTEILFFLKSQTDNQQRVIDREKSNRTKIKKQMKDLFLMLRGEQWTINNPVSPAETDRAKQNIAAEAARFHSLANQK